MEPWVSILGTAIPAIVAGRIIATRRRRRAQEPKTESTQWREKSSDDAFVCERVCISKRLLKKLGAYSQDSSHKTCITVCGVSELNVCADACAQAVCVSQHQVPNWNDICQRRCQSECLRLSSTSVY